MERDEWNALWAKDGPHDRHHHDDHDGSDLRHHHGSTDPDELLVRLVDGQPVGRALELGCGLGANAIWLARQGWQVLAIDLSDVAIDRARKRAKDAGAEVEFQVADLRDQQLTRRYDLVTLFYLHLSAAERQSLLERAAQVLAPGGTLIFVGHDRSDTDWLERHLHGDHGQDQDAKPTNDQARQARQAELEATLTRPDEVAAELPGLHIERAEAVSHDAHGSGEEAATTVVVAIRRSGGSG